MKKCKYKQVGRKMFLLEIDGFPTHSREKRTRGCSSTRVYFRYCERLKEWIFYKIDWGGILTTCEIEELLKISKELNKNN